MVHKKVYIYLQSNLVYFINLFIFASFIKL